MIFEILKAGLFALGAGLIIAFVTTFYLKKKDEVTRVAGLILEIEVSNSIPTIEL